MRCEGSGQVIEAAGLALQAEELLEDEAAAAAEEKVVHADRVLDDGEQRAIARRPQRIADAEIDAL